MPFFVDEKEIDESRMAGSSTNFGEAFLASEHVDERRLSDVGAADEGEFRQGGIGTVF